MDLIRITDWEDPEATETPLAGRLYRTRLTGWHRYIALAPTLLFLVSLGKGGPHSPNWYMPDFLIFFGGLAVTATLGIFTARALEALRERRLLQYLKNRMDIPSEIPQFGVEVTYSKRGLPYGRDLGVVTFREGVIDFIGRNSRFSIPTVSLPGFSGLSPINANHCSSRIEQGPYRAKVDIRFHSKMFGGAQRTLGAVQAGRLFYAEFNLSRCGLGDQTMPFLLPPQYPSTESLTMRSSMLYSTALLSLFMAAIAGLVALYLSGSPIERGLEALLIGAGVVLWQWGLLRILSSWYERHRHLPPVEAVVLPTTPIVEEQEVMTSA